MAFIDSKNILVLEKNSGEVHLVSDGILQDKPILTLRIDNTTPTCCRGLLGIETNNEYEKDEKITNVFIYLTEPTSQKVERERESTTSKDNGETEIRNRVYKFQWKNNELVNRKMLLDLPAEPGPNHPGGKLVLGIDDYLYTVIGDLNNDGKLQNFKDGPDHSDSSVILRINPTNGTSPADNPFFGMMHIESGQVEKYYAYGIRNSFGLAIDPKTGNLWDTENGDEDYDEINIIYPGFNSGWEKLMGPMSRSDVSVDDLVMFNGSHYRDPIFSWSPSLGVTDIEFLNSTSLGMTYAYNIFVGDITNGNLYFFEVNQDRTGILLLDSSVVGLEDFVADTEKELSSIVFGSGFQGITDIKTGPDGLLYVLTFDQSSDGNGKIYRIYSTDQD
jgi:glucose/arabinose dehydrogenase